MAVRLGQVYLTVIVGKGVHSNGPPLLKKMVKGVWAETGYFYKIEENEGRLRITLAVEDIRNTNKDETLSKYGIELAVGAQNGGMARKDNGHGTEQRIERGGSVREGDSASIGGGMYDEKNCLQAPRKEF